MDTDPSPRADVVEAAWQSYRLLADNAIDVVFEADPTTMFTWVSPSVEQVLGWRPDEVVGRRAADIVHPDDMAMVRAHAEHMNEMAPTQGAAAVAKLDRIRCLTATGGYKHLVFRARPTLGSDGGVVGHIITMQDTTERDDALRGLLVLGEGNRVLARVEDEPDLLQAMCETITSAGGYALAWYAALADEGRTVRPLAAAGSARDLVDTAAALGAAVPVASGPVAEAARTGATHVGDDGGSADVPTASDPFRAAALRSTIAMPVRVSGEVDGLLVVAASQPFAFDERAVTLLETLASDLGLGLHRLRASRALEQQTARLRGVFESQLDPFLLAEAVRADDGTIVDVVYQEASGAALDFWGLQREEVIGRRMSEVFPEEVGNGTLQAYARTIETGDPMIYDGVRVDGRRTGLSGYFDVRGVRTGDGVSVTFRDVTDKFEAAQRLAESESRYRMLAENATDVVLQATAESGVVWASESVQAVLGWRPDEVVGKREALWHPDDVEAAMSSLVTLARGLTAQGEARAACKDGSWRWVSYAAHRIQVGDQPTDIIAIRDIDEEVRARSALDFALGHDPLTGMATRPAMIERLGDLLASQARSSLTALLCVGVDRLSDVNEAYTHAAGDFVLTVIATRIAEVTGKPDLLARGTGVEFLVVLPDLKDGDDAARLAGRLLEAAKQPVHFGDVVIESTVSIGIAIGDRTSDREQLARDASAAMGQAKLSGRDRYAFADASFADQARHRLDVERRIREALDDDRFRAFFQPVLDLATREVTGYESLVRVERTDGTVAPPSHFIPIAELSPLIADIDLVMLHRGLDALVHLPEPLTVAVNLSTVTLTRPGYTRLIEQAIRESEARTSRLHLEVTETALLGDTREIVAAMHAIAAHGPRWYVDDFGTGYSSISHLRDLPIAGLKLDVSFSAGVRDGDQKSIRLAQALAGLASGLGLDTVAEGIESEDEAALLRAQGWRHGQGWLFGRPSPLD